MKHPRIPSMLVAGSLAALLGTATQTRAGVIYTYAGSPTYQGQNGYAAVGTTLVLELTDAAVATGRFTLSGYGSLDAVSYTGDVSGLVGFTTPGPFTATRTSIDGGGYFALSLTFDATGAIASDTVEYYGLNASGVLSGNQSLTIGTIGSDALGCDSDAASGVCTVSGSWTQGSSPGSTNVPEPTSLALLAGGCALAIARRRRKAS